MCIHFCQLRDNGKASPTLRIDYKPPFKMAKKCFESRAFPSKISTLNHRAMTALERNVDRTKHIGTHYSAANNIRSKRYFASVTHDASDTSFTTSTNATNVQFSITVTNRRVRDYLMCHEEWGIYLLITSAAFRILYLRRKTSQISFKNTKSFSSWSSKPSAFRVLRIQQDSFCYVLDNPNCTWPLAGQSFENMLLGRIVSLKTHWTITAYSQSPPHPPLCH